MMAVSQNIIVRKVREEDYEAVLNINRNFLNGIDYMYFYYKELINDPDMSYYVCEVDGEVVALEGVALIDDNRTLMTRSARVKDKFQGQGLLNLIRKKIYEDYKDVPGEKRIRTCCTNIVRLVNSKTFRDLNKTLDTRKMTLYQPVEEMKLPASLANTFQEVKTLDTENLATIFQNRELVNYLFPTGIVDIASWFFDPLVSNIRHIKKQEPYVIISAELDDSVTKLTFSNSGKSLEKVQQNYNTPLQGLLSFNTYYLAPSKIIYTANIYGVPAWGKEEADLKHIIFHGLQYAKYALEKEQFKLPLSVGFSVKDSSQMEICKKFVDSLGFEQGDLSSVEAFFYFEQEFEKLLTV